MNTFAFVIFIVIGVLALVLCGVISSALDRGSRDEKDTRFDGQKLYDELNACFEDIKSAYQCGDKACIYNANVAEMQCVCKIKQLIGVQDDTTMNFLPANDIGWMIFADAVNKPVQKRQYWYRQIGALVQKINTYRYIHENAPKQVY